MAEQGGQRLAVLAIGCSLLVGVLLLLLVNEGQGHAAAMEGSGTMPQSAR